MTTVTLSPLIVRRVAAVLDLDAESVLDGAVLPPLWHWAYVADVARQADLGVDGHPRRQDSWATDLPRRMYAGGRLLVEEPLRIGAEATFRSETTDVSEKQGRRGRLLFVTVRDELTDEHGGRLVEERDLVYLAGSAPATTTEPLDAPTAPWSRDQQPDAVLLFRFSAVTFNGHRIHYDRGYATGEEGYPDLVVHGPLLALWLCELARTNASGPVRQFSFRARQPVFLGESVALRGWPSASGAELSAYSRGSSPALTATVRTGQPRSSAHQ